MLHAFRRASLCFGIPNLPDLAQTDVVEKRGRISVTVNLLFAMLY